MSRNRADLGFADALDGFNPVEWTPEPTRTQARAPAAETRRTAEATGFVSRQAPQTPQPERAGGTPPLRRRRTGRNVQFNLKVRPETIESFCAIADAQGWGLGETLEHAVLLLQREFGTGGAPAPDDDAQR